ncbi:alpha-L-arabinofuranosidase C-terminal domain-containing protein [Mollicutes bacterium LVI A0039]|nr:alpha-L-arabinofuranosidase C-terminal domain-containing protein [Mollicutes bacterium LVI A0039]
MVNVIAPIFTEVAGRVGKQATYYPFQLMTTYGLGTVLTSQSQAPTVSGRCRSSNGLIVGAVHNQVENRLNIFVTNVAAQSSHQFKFDFPGFGNVKFID